MVKHAADEQEPLLTAEERVERAFDKLTGRADVHRRAAAVARPHPAAPDRRTCRSSEDDFDIVPDLSDAGGWGRANRVFGGQAARPAQPAQRGDRSMSDVVQKALGLLPHPAPRRHRLRRLHRADHLPALPQDGRRAGRRAAQGLRLADAASSRVRHRTSPTTTSTCSGRSGKQPGILGDIYAGAQSRVQQPGQPEEADRPDRRDRVDRASTST